MALSSTLDGESFSFGEGRLPCPGRCPSEPRGAANLILGRGEKHHTNQVFVLRTTATSFSWPLYLDLGDLPTLLSCRSPGINRVQTPDLRADPRLG